MLTKEQWCDNIVNLYEDYDIDTLESIYFSFKQIINKVLHSKYNRPIDECREIADFAKYYIDLYYMEY